MQSNSLSLSQYTGAQFHIPSSDVVNVTLNYAELFNYPVKDIAVVFSRL
jgi:hypothetical protein